MREAVTFNLPKPRRAVIAFMVLFGAVWLFFAAGINWVKAGTSVFDVLVGSDAILHGEVWRLATTWLLHQPSGPGSVGHLITVLLGLYFLAPSIEERWGGKRFAMFVVASGVFAAACQVLLGQLITQLHAGVFFGALGVVDAIAVAWGLSFRNQQVRLFFVLPITGIGLVAITFAMNVLYIIGLDERFREGLVTPFAGMFAGYLFGDSSPLRRLWLKARLKRLESQKTGLSAAPAARSRAKLRVIEGGRHDEDPPKKEWLN